MVAWNDVSSFSQGDKERIPNCWKIKGGKLTVTVHRHIHFKKDDWLLSCEPWFSQHLLDSKEVEEAKNEALQKVRGALAAAVDAFAG